MRRLFVFLAIFVTGGAMAEGFPCPEPQYAFLKDASKAEMREEYCRLTRKAISNEKSYQLTLEMIAEKKALNLSDPKDREKGASEMRAAGTCRVSAGAIADALFRRFKSKPPASCT